MAYGAARSRIPRTKRPFTVVPKKEAKRLGRYQKGRYTHYKPETVWNRLPQIDVQERRARRAHLKPRTSPKIIKGAGTVMLVGGKALPTLAYGYVGYDIIRRRQRGENVSPRRELEKTTFGIAIDDAPGIASDAWSSMQTVTHLAKPLAQLAWRLA